jgi:hypothetical protein
MGLLTEAGLDQLVSEGCSCGSQRLAFRAYVDGRWPVLGGEPVGAVTWVFDGEKFVDGVFEVRCADCQRERFSADLCPRCHAPGGLAKALATGNQLPAPASCSKCDTEELRYYALVPARVTYEGKRAADRVRTSTEFYDPAFHGYRVECGDCGPLVGVEDRCPLCNAPGPLRARPG